MLDGGRERKNRRSAANAARKAQEVVLQAQGDSIGYLGRLLSYNDDWLAVAGNLRKARAKWARLSKILGREGVDAVIASKFYIAVVQSILLFGSETWVVTPRILNALEGFHHRVVARRLTGRTAQRHRDGSWTYPDIRLTLEEAGLFPMHVYITRRQNTIAAYVATRPIGDIARTEEPPSGAHRLRWWDQEGLIFEEAEADIFVEAQYGD